MTDEAIELEIRTVRLLFHLGYFSRQRVALKSYFHPERVDVTDIDAYGIKWDIDFSPRIVVSQCRTGHAKSQEKPANSILWLRGLKELMKASDAYLVMPSIPQRLKTFAHTNGLVPLDYPRLEELEKQLGISQGFGSFDSNAFQRRVDVWNEISKDPSRQFSSIYWFLVSDFWSMPNNIRIKRCIAYYEQLVKYGHLDRFPIQWLIFETVILFSVALLNFCHEVFAMSSQDRKKYVEVKMIEGLGTVEDEDKVLQYANALAASIVEEKTGQKVKLETSGMKMLAPSYTPMLIEIVERVVDKSELSINIPRLLDAFLYEFVLIKKTVDRNLLLKLFAMDAEKLELLVKLTKNTVRFLDREADSRPIFALLLTF